MLRKLFEVFASLKLAVCLLAVLIVASATGTWYESKFNADVAREYIYNAWWFNVWMVLLGVNLFCAAAIRYPWKPHQTGFVITHAGLITLLIGGLIDRKWGVEGTIELNRGDAPASRLELYDQQFAVFTPDQPEPSVTVFRARGSMEDILGSSYLGERDVTAWPKLLGSLLEDGPMTAPCPARRVWRSLPEPLQKELKALKVAATSELPVSAALRSAVLSGLNDILEMRDFHSETDFAGVAISDECKRLLAEPRELLSSRQLQRLNRLLLEAGFPDALRPGRLKAKPLALRAPSDEIQVRVVDMQAAKREIAGIRADPSGFPALKLVLTMAGRDNPFFLALGEEETPMPLATLGFKRGMPPASRAQPGPQPGPKPSGKVPQSERHYTYAKPLDNPDMVTPIAGPPANVRAQLLLDEKGANPKLTFNLQGKTFAFEVLPNAGKELDLDGAPGWKIAITGYYPNFKIAGGKPFSDGEKPENPCAVFELHGPLVDAVASAKPPSAHGGGEPADEGAEATPNGITVYLGDDGKLRYFIRSKKNGDQRGEVALGAPLELGWGNSGAKAAVQAFEPKGLPAFQWLPIKSGGAMDGQHIALKCEVTAGGATQSVWVGPSPSGSLTRFPLDVGGKKVELAFANMEVQLPFSVELLKFRSPNQEGLEGSDQFAAFESTLSFDGKLDKIVLKPDSALMKSAEVQKRAGVLEGAITNLNDTNLTFAIGGNEANIERGQVEAFFRQTHKIHMNHPTTYPVTWYGPWLGTSYKFSQASFKQGSAETSIVQVLRDPGWMPKWVGSLMICFGIFTMFYLKPYFRRAVETAKEPPPVAEQPAAKGQEEKSKARKEVAVKGT
ncbi:MAG: hypothetical protein HY291_00050 [Planctomycetes bacterium]|nr:hypothetical protein [Planctomycetota bacterium]